MTPGPTSNELARAKVNLTLRVHGRRRDGYHELESLAGFAHIGDELEFTAGAELALAVEGPFAHSIVGDNLVLAAARAVAARWPAARLGAFRLVKRLPVAAGLGGGSADAAAALRLLRRLNAPQGTDADWAALAAGLGSDVSVCLLSAAALMRGRGEIVEAVPALPALPAVLVNPGVPLATAAVFGALAAPPLADAPRRPPAPAPFADAAAAIAELAIRSNDLEAAARRLCPAIDEVLAQLRAAPGCGIARLTGSGPTCFALFADPADADAAAGALSAARPGWWVARTTLS